MKDHQPGYAQPIPLLGAKIKQHQATPEDRLAIERCKFEQKRHDLPEGGWVIHFADKAHDNRPVPKNVRVAIRVQLNGELIDVDEGHMAGDLYWGVCPEGTRIVAYKVMS